MRRHIVIFLLILAFSCTACSKSETDIKVSEPVIMGTGSFGDYVLALRLYEGKYESDYAVGPGFGPNWTGKYELAVMESGSDTVLSRYELTGEEETLCFQESFALQVTDLNADGCMEVLIGQYGTSNFNLYKMYYIDENLQIGYYTEIGELTISSQEMSPALEVSGDKIVYSFYDNAKGASCIIQV
ncbi:MAG: hypothetical protein LUH19_00395 [Lachnospiraceae bacterium]|nr:hypothetical protein [Lachnospiraceae bacterium]